MSLSQENLLRVENLSRSSSYAAHLPGFHQRVKSRRLPRDPLKLLRPSRRIAQRDVDLGSDGSTLKRILRHEALIDDAQSTQALVKRFVDFLRDAYPLEMETFTLELGDPARDASQALSLRGARAAHPRPRRIAGMKRGKKLPPGCDTTTTTLPTPPRPTCTCPTVCPTEPLRDLPTPDKWKLFFSNPPMCRPTTTIDPWDVPAVTDLCGHMCNCHTEPPTTDNDKEIFVGTSKEDSEEETTKA